GGATQAWALEPDMVTIGKAIGGGIPCGAYGISGDVAQRIEAEADADLVDTGGVGGTLAGNALSVAAMRATLEEVLTPDAFERMIRLAERYASGLRRALQEHRVPWSVVQLGARVEFRFSPSPPVDGGASAAAADARLDEYMHLLTTNRGVLLTPFHNMALTCPATTAADVDQHVAVFADAVTGLYRA
ncbi:MAG: aminotransferase class III-fold pyridoxal phosphate-dependent enzyme, partial [Candidatus Dormibacteria bacterium]